MKTAKLSLNEAQHRMDTLLDELRQEPQLTLHTDPEVIAILNILWGELGDRGKFRAVRIGPSLDLMEIRSILLDAEFEEYYFPPDDAATCRPPVSSPFMAPDLASQLERVVQLGDAEVDYAKPQLPPAQAIMDRMIEELRTSECVDLYDLEQVHAFLEIRKQLGNCGRLRRVKNKCPDDAVALEMWQVLFENGFEQYFEVPPVPTQAFYECLQMNMAISRALEATGAFRYPHSFVPASPAGAKMKVNAAFLLGILGGNTCPLAEDLKDDLGLEV